MATQAALRQYYTDGVWLKRHVNGEEYWLANCRSVRVAKLIANALNLYRPKVRRRKSAEKAV